MNCPIEGNGNTPAGNAATTINLNGWFSDNGTYGFPLLAGLLPKEEQAYVQGQIQEKFGIAFRPLTPEQASKGGDN